MADLSLRDVSYRYPDNEALTLEAPFAEQGFHRFRIDNPTDDEETALVFSMDSDVLLAADAGGAQ